MQVVITALNTTVIDKAGRKPLLLVSKQQFYNHEVLEIAFGFMDKKMNLIYVPFIVGFFDRTGPWLYTIWDFILS